jgi:DNA-binding MarR family transcriptional regulator
MQMHPHDSIAAMNNSADLAIWARFTRVSQSVLADVEAELKSAGFPPLGWYDALLELRRVAPEGLRQFELRERMLLAQYNLSRLTDRLADAGLVRRTPCPEDRRGQIVYLTEKGRALLDAMWPTYREAVNKHFTSRIGPEDSAALAAVLNGLRPALSPGTPGMPQEGQ